ncbi:MAG: LCP family protein [Microcoleaceae cyanobacterium]
MVYPFLRSRTSRSTGLILGLLLIGVGTVATALGAMTAVLRSTGNPAQTASSVLNEFWRDRFHYQLSRPVNILVMGIDQVPNATPNSNEIFSGRSDTLFVVRFDPENKSVSLLSIPRDTEIELPDIGVGKLNEANYWGGTRLATQAVEDLLTPLQVDRYVRVSRGAFQELVNLIGGVEVFVPYPMSYTDQAQQLNIQLASGWQTMDGEAADHFIRFRSDAYGDIGRIQRQQALLKSIRERLLRPSVLPKLPQMIRVMQKYVDTDLSFEEMLTLANFGLKLDAEQFQMVMLPGRSSDPNETFSSYWLMDEAGRDRILQEYFNLDTLASDAAETEATSDELPLDLKIAIQNASGQPEHGEQLLTWLADRGLYNAYLATNWPDQELHTQIIVQTGDLRRAEQLQTLVQQGKITAASTGEIGSDLTVRIGENWQPLF